MPTQNTIIKNEIRLCGCEFIFIYSISFAEIDQNETHRIYDSVNSKTSFRPKYHAKQDDDPAATVYAMLTHRRNKTKIGCCCCCWIDIIHGNFMFSRIFDQKQQRQFIQLNVPCSTGTARWCEVRYAILVISNWTHTHDTPQWRFASCMLFDTKFEKMICSTAQPIHSYDDAESNRVHTFSSPLPPQPPSPSSWSSSVSYAFLLRSSSSHSTTQCTHTKCEFGQRTECAIMYQYIPLRIISLQFLWYYYYELQFVRSFVVAAIFDESKLIHLTWCAIRVMCSCTVHCGWIRYKITHSSAIPERKCGQFPFDIVSVRLWS